MDGNGRWATAQNMQRVKGHEKGATVVRDITTYAAKHPNIKRLTLYAFSTENWKRPKLEVDFLMKLLEKYLKKELQLYIDSNVKFEAIGDLSKFSPSLQKQIALTQEKTAHCTGLVQSLALNYGALDEITRAVQKLDTTHPITPEAIQANLDVSCEVDLLIRTGGDHRLSNFLLWQAAYAELFFLKTLWPDFTSDEFEKILGKFDKIDRRFGGLNQ
jgi:undecaprenyl diphosphate synthase